MKTDPDDFAVRTPAVYGHVDDIEHERGCGGMSIRETMAMHIMAGFAGAPGIRPPSDSVATLAVKWADALIAALNAPKPAARDASPSAETLQRECSNAVAATPRQCRLCANLVTAGKVHCDPCQGVIDESTEPSWVGTAGFHGEKTGPTSDAN